LVVERRHLLLMRQPQRLRWLRSQWQPLLGLMPNVKSVVAVVNAVAEVVSAASVVVEAKAVATAVAVVNVVAVVASAVSAPPVVVRAVVKFAVKRVLTVPTHQAKAHATPHATEPVKAVASAVVVAESVVSVRAVTAHRVIAQPKAKHAPRGMRRHALRVMTSNHAPTAHRWSKAKTPTATPHAARVVAVADAAAVAVVAATTRVVTNRAKPKAATTA
jgi:hypothetical protein